MPIALVAGALANKPWNGGEAWVRLSWARGLARMGWDVWLVERIAEPALVDEAGRSARFGESANRAWFERVTADHGFAGRAALVCDGVERATWGLAWAELLDLAASAELLVDISGNLSALNGVRERVRRSAFVDLDPGFTQAWNLQGLAPIPAYDRYFTVALLAGDPSCRLPADGIEWRPVLQPVVLDDWPPAAGGLDRFTTIAGWRSGFGPVTHEGRTYGLKVHEFRKMLELPRRTGLRFELALAIDPADEPDRRALLDHGWELVDPRAAAGDPEDFRAYVRSSGAEFSVAQGIYVEMATGWFSDRTARYLAAGRPALVQETGFSRRLSAGEGLVAFRTLDEAAAGAERIARDYEGHARAARRIAEERLDSDLVLAGFLEQAGVVGG